MTEKRYVITIDGGGVCGRGRRANLAATLTSWIQERFIAERETANVEARMLGVDASLYWHSNYVQPLVDAVWHADTPTDLIDAILAVLPEDVVDFVTHDPMFDVTWFDPRVETSYRRTENCLAQLRARHA